MKVGGEIIVPGDKSISHRALILAVLADGVSRVERVLDAADVRSTAAVLRSLGADIPSLSASLEIRGAGLRGLKAPGRDLDCGNSGTTARLLAGVVAGHPFAARFAGDASLSRRPMHRVARPLRAMGARVELECGDGLPMWVEGGTLRPLEWRTEAASAQVKSALLLAGLVGTVPVAIREPAPSRDHTERMLAARGVKLELATGRVSLSSPPRALQAADVVVPGDPSSASFFAALAALASTGTVEMPQVCVNPTRTGFFQVLRRMGADVSFERQRQEGGEPVALIRAAPGRLRATGVAEAEIPFMIDELPLMACVAARAEGTTEIRGAAELRVKESDRISAVVANLRGLGVDVEELPDGFRVRGGQRALRGEVCTHGDHRIAMAFGVLGALPGSAIVIDDPGCVEVSFPGFWAELARACRA